jgi:hypothetical protein
MNADMIQDKYMPVYHFNEVHRIRINSSIATVKSLVDKLDFSNSRLIRMLFFIRGMPAAMMNMRGLERGRFLKLELTDSEMIIGLIGQFWKPSGNLQLFKSEEFISFCTQDFLKAIWSFRVFPENGGCTLETETRIQCLGDGARRKFRIYWFFVRPFSALIRLEMLRAIRNQAESIEKLVDNSDLVDHAPQRS